MQELFPIVLIPPFWAMNAHAPNPLQESLPTTLVPWRPVSRSPVLMNRHANSPLQAR